MGMFDSVFVDCPNCYKKIEFQSKAGMCILETYKTDNVPVSIANDLHNTREHCSCGTEVRMLIKPMQSLKVDTFVVDKRFPHRV